MSGHNPPVAKVQPWRYDLYVKDQNRADQQVPQNQEIPKDPHLKMKFQPTQMLAGTTICCEDANCDKAKLESMPEHFFQDPAQPYGMVGHEGVPGRKDAPPMAPEPYFPAYCPCGVNRGQLVTICCVRRDCDEATKINEIREPRDFREAREARETREARERSKAYSHFKY